MHTSSNFGSFRMDSTVDAVIRSKRVVQSVSTNLTNLLQKIAREDTTFRVIVQEALKMKRDSPDQFLFETFDEYVYDSFVKLLLTTTDELFRQTLRKDRNIPQGRAAPCEPPVFKMINRVTDHTYRQSIPRKGSEKTLQNHVSESASRKSNTKGESQADFEGDLRERVDVLKRENEVLRLEVARCQRAIKRFTLPPSLALDSASVVDVKCEKEASNRNRLIEAQSLVAPIILEAGDQEAQGVSEEDAAKASSPTAAGQTLHSLLSPGPRRARKLKRDSAVATNGSPGSNSTGSATPTPTADGRTLRQDAERKRDTGTPMPSPGSRNSLLVNRRNGWFDYFLVIETTPAVDFVSSDPTATPSRNRGRPPSATRETLFRFPPTDVAEFPLDKHWGHFLSVPFEAVVPGGNVHKASKTPPIVYSAVLSGDKFISCVTVPSLALSGRRAAAAAAAAAVAAASAAAKVEAENFPEPELGEGSSSDEEGLDQEGAISSDEDTIDFVDEDLASGNEEDVSCSTSGRGTPNSSSASLRTDGTPSGSASPSTMSAQDKTALAKAEARARACAMTTFVLISRVPWFQLHENVAFRLFSMLQDSAHSSQFGPKDFLAHCAAEALDPLPLSRPMARGGSGGGGGGGGSKAQGEAEPQLPEDATPTQRFRWRLQQLFELRCFEDPAPGLLTNFPALAWTTSAANMEAKMAAEKAASLRTLPSRAEQQALAYPKPSFLNHDPASLDPWCFSLLHRLLSPSTIVTVLKSLLLCESVLLLSENLPVLAPISEAFRALMGPFPSTQVYIPYLPREQFQIVKSPFPFFVGSLVQDFQYVPEGVNFLTVMIDSDRAIPPLHGDDISGEVDFPQSLKLQLVSRITAEYRRFGAVETTNTEDNEVTDEVLQEAVRSGSDPALDALDAMDEGYDSPSNAGYQPSPKQRKAEIKQQYVALKRRMRTVKQLRDTSLEGSEEKAKHAAELRKLTRQYKAYHSAKLLEEASRMALGTEMSVLELADEQHTETTDVKSSLLQRLRTSDKEHLQPHLVSSGSNEFAAHMLLPKGVSGGNSSKTSSLSRLSKSEYLKPARQEAELLAFVAGLRAACAEVNKCLLTFFSFHDMLYNVEPEALKTHHESLEFAVRHPQGTSQEEQQSNLQKLRTVEFYQRLVASQNYQLFKEERLQADDRAHDLTTKFRRQSRTLMNRIIDEKDSMSP